MGGRNGSRQEPSLLTKNASLYALNTEIKHISTSGPACFALRTFLCGEAEKSQGRIYLELQHLSQPRMHANLQNCINAATKSFRKVCGSMQYNQRRP